MSLFVVVLLAAASALSDLNALANMESYQKQADLSYTQHWNDRACMSNPCQNGGHCVKQSDSYECRCDDRCTSGTHCEILEEDCQSDMFAHLDYTAFNSSSSSVISRLRNHLLEDYDKMARPIVNLQDPRVPVTVGVAVYSVSDVDPVNSKWTANVMMRVRLTDPYLSWDPAEWGGITEMDFTPNHVDLEGGEIWVPDITIQNAREHPKISHKAAFVYPSGFVWWAFPMVVEMSCGMDLSAFPFVSDDEHALAFCFRFVRLLTCDSLVCLIRTNKYVLCT